MVGKRFFEEDGEVRRHWIGRVAADGALALAGGLLVVSLLAIPAVRRVASPGADPVPRGVAAASPVAARAARRREHMARLPRWREIRREARSGGAPAGSPTPIPASPPAASPLSTFPSTARPDTPCAAGCAATPRS